MDAEFVAQMLQLKYSSHYPQIRVPGTLDALAALRQAKLLDADDADLLSSAYRFLRSVEARIRLMDSAGRHEFPFEERELAKLAFLLETSAEALQAKVTNTFASVRSAFERVFDAS